MSFFFDESISSKIVKDLRSYFPNHGIHAHNESFREGIDDVVWIASISGWTPKPVIVSCDLRLCRALPNIIALKDANTSCILLNGGFADASFPDQAAFLLRKWDAIAYAVERLSAPTILHVSHRHGRIKLGWTISALITKR